MEKHSQTRIVLNNQYFVGHKVGAQSASPNDSGPICYLHSNSWDVANQWQLRPSRLLNGYVSNNVYNHEILSPLDAVLLTAHKSRIRFSLLKLPTSK
jgi:hypothetical protein